MQSTIFEFPFFSITLAPTWYGAMYALGFLFCYLFMRKYATLSLTELDTLLMYVFFGVIIGGRLGYIGLYNPLYFIANPLEMIKIWQGGMSFHGGFLGVLIAIALFARKYRKHYFDITDPLAVSIPIALGLGRIGNWINQELPGYNPYSGPFPMVIGGVPHFPSPLFEMFLEGVVLSLIMLFFAKKYLLFSPKSSPTNRPTSKPALLSALFLIGYALARLIAEGFRLPDAHIGYLFGSSWITLGILYTLPMFIGGAFLFLRNYHRKTIK